MVAQANVVAAAGEQLYDAWKAVDKRDRERFGCAFVRKHERLTMRGQFDENDARDEAETIRQKIVKASSEGRGKDWIAFFEKLIALWVQIAPLFVK